MKRPSPNRPLVLLICALVVFAIPSLANAGGDETEAEPQATAVTPVPSDAGDGGDTDLLHGQVVRGLPFSNFDLLVLVAVLVGLSAISFAVHRLNRDRGRAHAETVPEPAPNRPLDAPAEPAPEHAAEAPVTTDAG